MEFVNAAMAIFAVLGIAWALGGGMAALVKVKLPWWANFVIGLIIEAVVALFALVRQ